jgi:hypothetical protein
LTALLLLLLLLLLPRRTLRERAAHCDARLNIA